MQKQCIDELDLFLLKKNISGSAENTLREFYSFFRNQKRNVDMSYFLKQPVIERAKEIDEATEGQLDTLAPEEQALFKKTYYKQNMDIKNSTFADLYLHEYAVFMKDLESLNKDWQRLKKETGSRFYKNRVILVEYDNKTKIFSLVKRPKGRPRAEEQRKRISLRVDNDKLSLIENYCNEMNLTQQEFLLKAIDSIIKPDKVEVENPILDLMQQRYDIEGSIIAMYRKIVSKK